jgi:hypothetical protein
LIAQRLKNHPADAAESVDSYFDSHILFILCFGGINFLKPMGKFSGEWLLVNAELADILAKTMPFFAVGFRRKDRIRAGNGNWRLDIISVSPYIHNVSLWRGMSFDWKQDVAMDRRI